MPFTINDPEIERLARELAEASGEPMPHAVAVAVRERLQRLRAARQEARAGDTSDNAADVPTDEPRPQFRCVAEIQAYVASLPELDARTPDEVLGYDALGLPT